MSFNRVLVIAMCAQNADFIHDWASKLNIKYHLQPPSVRTNHNVGESLSYFEYIVSHYENLKDYTIFVDDAGPNHWHANKLNPSWENMIKNGKPDRFISFGMILEDKNMVLETSRHISSCSTRQCPRKIPVCYFRRCYDWDELPCIYKLLKTLNITYDQKKHDFHSGTSFILTRDAIKSIPRSKYKKIVNVIRNWSSDKDCLNNKWGYALDRVKGVIWT